MNQVSRYVVVKAVRLPEGELVPVWDSRLKYRKNLEYGHMVKVDGHSTEYSTFVDAIYDLKKGIVTHGIEVDVYPQKNQMEFSKGEAVYFEVGMNSMEEGVIEDIVFEEYDMDISKGSKLEGYQVKHYNIKDLDPEKIYAIKRWKPTFVLNDGTKILYKYQMKHKAKK